MSLCLGMSQVQRLLYHVAQTNGDKLHLLLCTSMENLVNLVTSSSTKVHGHTAKHFQPIL